MPEIKGIDVSSWQGKIDWNKVKASGIEFAIIRACYGLSLDRMFVKNIIDANAANLNCGVYVYSCADTKEEAIKEAENILQLVKPYKLTYPIIFDIEDKVHHKLNNSQRADLVEAFCNIISKNGYHTGVYTSLSWFNSMFDMSRINKYDKWVAQWSGNKSAFADFTAIWQYSNKGIVSGIYGDVDMNISYKDYANISPKDNIPVVVKPKPFILKTGAKIALNAVALYASAQTSTVSRVASGTYWIYSDVAINGRIKITTSEQRVGKIPAFANVTGFIKISDIAH